MGNTPPVGRKVTLSDIAAGCDVSRATVSLVLRGSPLVNKHTRARVEEELRRQGYVYNRAAANLRRRTSSSIALVLNDLANPFFAEFAAGVDEILGSSGYVTLLGSSSESTERELAVLGSLVEHGPAGIILSPAEGGDAEQILGAVGSHTPLLLFNREVGGDISACDHWDRLFLDNQRGARLATEHLITQGHQRIAFYGGHGSSSSCQQRRAGYTEAMQAAGLPTDARWVVECVPNRLDAVAQCEQLFIHDSSAPTAAVCYNDAVALGLMLGLHQRGLQPGRDFALTGFDDIAEAAVSAPLTTLAVTPRDRGRQAAELILQRLQDPSSPPRQTIVPVQLLVRASSCAPHA
jgi:LacI family transcriptional regulator